jgi:CubicO group peptidase (beta-lactamase class C family)
MRGERVCALLALISLSLPAAAQADCDFSAADAAMQGLLAADGIADGGLVIGSARGIWHTLYFGAYDDTTVLPLASASKLLSGVRIMQLVDRGVLDLDAPVSGYLSGPQYPWSATAAPITLRQMFSHTAGYGDDEDDPVLSDHTITLAQSVQEIASNYEGLSPQNYLPVGAYFAYGGVSMQIGGGVAQAQSGVDWQQGWRQDIGAPMCIGTIDWQGLGPTVNYRIAGSARASLPDYARVLAMLAGGGVGNGTRILSADAIATLNHSQTGNAVAGYTPPAADGLTQYGIGAWIEPAPTSVSTDAPVIESIGAFGYAPWVDFSNGTFGILMVADPAPGQNPGTISRPVLQQIVQIVRDQLAANAGQCAPSELYDAIYANGFQAQPDAPDCAAGTVAN